MRSRPVQLAAAAAVFVCLLSTGPVFAASKESKQAAAKDRIDRISGELGQGRAELDSARSEAQSAAGREAEYTSLISSGAEKAARLGDRVTRSERSLERARKRLERARRLLERRLVAIYMGGVPDTTDLALGSNSFADLSSGSVYLRAITDSDSRMAARVAELRADLADMVADLAAAKAAVDAHNADLEEARAGIAAARAAAESTADRLAGLNAARQGEIESLKSDIDAWQKQIEQEELARQQEADEEAAAESAEEQVEQNLGGPYSIPTYIVMCESGGNYSALNPSSGAGGAYQIMPSTWAAYGGKGLPNEASKSEQDRIAALIWADSGPGAWSCA
ncbi:MAG: transglycosylase family protein [Solirubrobacterales bacterium]|nr:transglycosylase family protein [Solirubrobacterales bacterium]